MVSVNTRIIGCVVWFAWLATGSTRNSRDTELNRTVDCIAARSGCEGDVNCAVAMLRVFDNEKCTKALGYDDRYDQIKGPAAKVCPRECALAIYNLTSLAKGELLQDCECVNRDSICLTLKARMNRCVDTLSGPRNNTKPGCTAVRSKCTSDKLCDEAQKNFLHKCTRMISGVQCTEECKRSIEHMLSVPYGEGLDDCECDGYEEPHCRGIWAHYRALCFAPSGPRRHTPTDRTPLVGERRNHGRTLRSLTGLTSAFTIVILVYLNIFL